MNSENCKQINEKPKIIDIYENKIAEIFQEYFQELKSTGLIHPSGSQSGISSPEYILFYSINWDNNKKKATIPFDPKLILKLFELIPEIKDEIVEYNFNEPSIKFDNIWFFKDEKSPMIIELKTKNRYFMVGGIELPKPKKIEVDPPKKIEVECPNCNAKSIMLDPFEHPLRWDFQERTMTKLFICKGCMNRLVIKAHITSIEEG